MWTGKPHYMVELQHTEGELREWRRIIAGFFISGRLILLPRSSVLRTL